MRNLVLAALLVATTLAGCLTGTTDLEVDAYRPGEDWQPTGRTIHLEATVVDLVNKEIYPGLNANMWGFCVRPARADDLVSAAAIEYAPDAGLDVPAGWEGMCSAPGPTLRVQQGDTVIVDFENNHVHPHTIHWHGQYVPWEADGVPGSTQDSVEPGQSFRYEFVAERAGTLWYHCHVDTQFHVMQGLYGVMIVEPQDTSQEPDVDRDQVLVLSTLQRDLVEATPRRLDNPHADHTGIGGCGSTGEQGCQNPAVDITPDTFMINGVSFPNTIKRDDTWIQLAPDETVRVRFLNAGTTTETIHVHGHDFQVTHVDGNPIPPVARYYVDTLPISPAQRYDVVLEGRENNAGVWVIHTHNVDHVTNDGQYPGGMLTKIAYPEFWDDLTPFDGVELAGGKPYEAPLVLPADYEDTAARDIGAASNEVAETFEFPVEMACAVKAIRLTVTSDSAAPATQQFNGMEAIVTSPGGDAEHLELGAGRVAVWRLDPAAGDHAEEGNYTVMVTGTAVETRLGFDVFVDYFDSLADHDAAGRPCEEGEH